MKKKIIAILIMVSMLISLIGGISAYAMVSVEECDKCFISTMNTLLDREDVAGESISATRKPVYDIKLEQLGYVYEYEVAEQEGYAIIICDDGAYVAIEVFTDSVSPYSQVPEAEQNVFVNTMSYYKAVEGEIRIIETDETISAEAYAVLEENAILYKNSGLEDAEYVDIVIEYTGEPVEDYHKMSYKTPEYGNVGLTGGCAAVAGGNLIGYFDRYYEDLIPNHAAGEMKLGYYFYSYADDFVLEAIDTLYVDMNGDGSGITEANFKSGLQKYCSRKGLSCSFTSLKSWGKLNYDSVKSSMKDGKPVALLLNTYNT